MNILCIAQLLPMPDRQTGMLRLFQMLRVLAKRHRVLLCVIGLNWQRETYGDSEVERYRKNLSLAGIESRNVSAHEFGLLLKRERFDAVLFEHFEMITCGLVDFANLRFWQPEARIIVDTVDVAFQHLTSRAESTNSAVDRTKALEIKEVELAAYRDADVVITTSYPDKRCLEDEGLRARIEIIPLIHRMHELSATSKIESRALIFVGNFGLDANVDAIVYFVNEVFPRILKDIPEARLVIAGNAPTVEVYQLATHNIEVVGYVPDLIPVYERCSVAVVPVRWGGGLKGKVVEAMSLGVPVVASPSGLEGFGLKPYENIMLGDTPDNFAAAVIRLWKDRELYERIRANAWQFANDYFSEAAVEKDIDRIFNEISRYPVKCISRAAKARRITKLLLNRYVLWRFASIRVGRD